jgi:acyl-CoA synthetase (AMP-forming)/AMP-acid ligase II
VEQVLVHDRPGAIRVARADGLVDAAVEIRGVAQVSGGGQRGREHGDEGVAALGGVDVPSERREVARLVDPSWAQRAGDAMRAAWADSLDREVLVDRKTDSMRRRGENISSWEVEREINAHSAVLESATAKHPTREALAHNRDEAAGQLLPKLSFVGGPGGRKAP